MARRKRPKKKHVAPLEVLPPPTDPRALLNEPSSAAYLGVKKRTLQNWRQRGEGPPFVRLGARIGYRLSRLDAYIAANEFTSTRGARPPEAA